MRGIAFHVRPEVAPHRARRRLGGVGRAHGVAPLGDGVVALEHTDEHRARRHELAQAAVERPLAVHHVEARRVIAREAQELARYQAQPRTLGARQDLADLALANGVRFDDRQRSLSHDAFRSARRATMVAPISAGLRAMRTPAASKAAILSAAVPRPPAMMAPAWPMRRPFGAVCPATNATTGLFMWSRMKAAACSSALPPISPITITASVAGSSWNRRSASTKLVPLIGSPPMPMQ